MGNTGQHHRAVLLHFGQPVGHAVEADIDIADLAGRHVFIEPTGTEIAVLHARGGEGQFPQGPVDESSNQRCTDQGQTGCNGQPNQPGLTASRCKTVAVGLQPIGVAVDAKADPKPGQFVHGRRDHGIRPESAYQLQSDTPAQGRIVKRHETVSGFAWHDADAFLVCHGFDERYAGDGVGVHQGRSAQVDQGRDLLRRLNGARLKFQRVQGLQPSQNAADQQKCQEEEGPPEQRQARAPLRRGHARCRLQWHRAAGLKEAAGGVWKRLAGAKKVSGVQGSSQGSSVRIRRWMASCRGIGHEDVTNTPNGLNVAWRSGVGFHQFAQARHLYIQAAVKGLEFAPPRQLSQFFAR